jgi:hypothetical protein
MASKKRNMLIKVGDSTYDKILAHYINPEHYTLSPTNTEILNRYNEVFTLRLAHFSSQQIVNKLVKDRGISQAQAYLDIRNSGRLFGNVMKADTEGSRALWIEYLMDFLKRCKQKGDRNNESKALKLLAEYGGLAHEDNPEFNPEKLENKEIRIMLPKQMLDVLKDVVGKGVVDFNNLDVTDINFDELEND